MKLLATLMLLLISQQAYCWGLGDLVQIQVETNNKPQNQTQAAQPQDQRQQANAQEARKKFEESITAATKEYQDGLKQVDEEHLAKACNSNSIEYAKDNGDGTVTDTRSGLVWQKCEFGQTWDGSYCSGSPKQSNWFTAMIEAKSNKFLGKTDWRLPTSLELLSVGKNGNECNGLIYNSEKIETTYLDKVRRLTSEFSRYATEAENSANNKQISELQNAFSENSKIRKEQFAQSKSISNLLYEDNSYWSITPFESPEMTKLENDLVKIYGPAYEQANLHGGASQVVNFVGVTRPILRINSTFYGRLVRAGALVEGEGLPEFEKLYPFARKFQSQLDALKEQAVATEAKQERDQKIAAEKQKKEREANIAAFRKNLKVGDTALVINGLLDTTRVLVLALNGNLVRIQVGYNEKWIRREELYPVSQ